MKLFFVVFVSALALSAADPQAKKDTSKESASATSKASDTAKPSAIPAGAVKGDDGDYHYTDTQGKKWIYHKTPFGMSRREDTGELETAKAPRRCRYQGHGRWRQGAVRAAGTIRRLEVGEEKVRTE